MGRKPKESDPVKWDQFKSGLEEPVVLTLVESGSNDELLKEIKPVLDYLNAKKRELSEKISIQNQQISKIEQELEVIKQECIKSGAFGAEAFLRIGGKLKVLPSKRKIKKAWKIYAGIPFSKLEDFDKAVYFAGLKFEDCQRRLHKLEIPAAANNRKLAKVNAVIALVNQIGSGACDENLLRMKIFYEIEQLHYSVRVDPLFTTRIQKLGHAIDRYIRKNGYEPMMDKRAKETLRKTKSAANPKNRAVDVEDARHDFIMKIIDSAKSIEHLDELCKPSYLAECLKTHRIDQARLASNFDQVNRADHEKSIFPGSDEKDQPD